MVHTKLLFICKLSSDKDNPRIITIGAFLPLSIIKNNKLMQQLKKFNYKILVEFKEDVNGYYKANFF